MRRKCITRRVVSISGKKALNPYPMRNRAMMLLTTVSVLAAMAGIGSVLACPPAKNCCDCPLVSAQTYSAAATSAPVYLFTGKVEELATDASLTGPGFSWSHTRTYSSLATDVDVQGEGWFAGMASEKVTWVGNNIWLHPSANHSWTFTGDGDPGTYTAPNYYRATMKWYGDDYDNGAASDNGTTTTLPIDDGPATVDALKWCLIRFTSWTNDGKIRTITASTAASITWEGAVSQVMKDDTFDVLDRVEVFLTDSQYTYEFAGKDTAWEEDERGSIRWREDAYGNRISFTYDTTLNRIETVTTTSGGSVVYSYLDSGSNSGKISHFVVEDHDEKPVEGVIYVYQDADPNPTYDEDNGTDGDLLLVHSCKDLAAAGTAANGSTEDDLVDSVGGFTANEFVGARLVIAKGSNVGQIRTITSNTTNTITVSEAFSSSISNGDSYFVVKGDIRTTHYRYWKTDGEGVEGKDHLLKGVFDADSVHRMIDASPDIDEPMDILHEACSFVVTDNKTLKDYASRSFTYYTENVGTNDIETVWKGGAENLDSKYSGTNLNEQWYAKSETIRAGCSSCGGGDSTGGVTHTFYYMHRNTGANPDTDEVRRLIIQDISNSDGEFVRREIYGLNEDRLALRRVTATGDIDTPVYHCTSQLVGSNTELEMNQPIEERKPSAHTVVTYDAEDATIVKFLNPSGGGPAPEPYEDMDKNDYDTLNASSGVIHVSEYNDDGRRTGYKIKKGLTGTAYYVSATDYGDGTEGHPKRLPEATYEYRTWEEDDRSAGEKTEYTYVFWPDTNDEQIQKRTTTYPIIATTENGSNVAITEGEYYDESPGNLIWSHDGEKHVNYYEYDEDTGQLTRQVVDVNTDDPPGGVPEPPDTDFETDSGLNLDTTYAYDDLGRQITVTDPASRVTHTVYLQDETRVYPVWDSDSDKPLQPIQVTITDDAGNTTDTYAVDPTNVDLDDPPDGTESLVRSSSVRWLSWTRNNYNPGTGRLESTDTYHKIPADDGDYGQENVNFYRTRYYYDEMGRTYKTVSPSGHISYTVYDDLGRTIETWAGTNDTAGTPSDPSGGGNQANNMEKMSRTFYDETTPGNHTEGVGDGLVTSACSYYDSYSSSSADTNAVVTIYWHDWRGNLRATVNEEAPHTVQDVDNMGRVIAVAQYKGTQTWSSVIDDIDYAFSVPGAENVRRGTLSETKYDQLGRVYRSETHAVKSDGELDKKLVTDNYYDRNGRLVATYANARGGREIAFDGVGRTIEDRLVKDLITGGANGKYDATGAFRYLDPKPGDTTGGLAGVLTISRSTYDAGGNVTESYNMEANHDADDGISLTTHNYVQTTTFSWYDDAGRLTDTADYGTNNTDWTYADAPTYDPDTEPTRSDIVLVTSYTYDAASRVETVTDPRNIATKFHYDDAGRTTATIANYKSGSTYWTLEPLLPKDRDPDVCQITAVTYDVAGNSVTQTAVDPDDDGDTSDNQVTFYNYQDPYNPSLATRIKYPDSVNAQYDSITMTYALDGQVVTRTAQRKAASDTPTTITFEYDDLRRLQKQRVTSIDTDAVDDSVKSMKYTYDELSRRKEITSYSDDSCSTAVNEILYVYNEIGALEEEYQAHIGVKSPGTPHVDYRYDETHDGTVYTKGMRLNRVKYPNDRYVHYTYTADSIADKLSRVDAIKNDDNGDPGNTSYAAYNYCGAGRMVVENFLTQPQLRLDYWGQESGTYAGFDRFGRIRQQLWHDYTGGGAGVDRDKFSYDYDRNSNRLYRKNEHTDGAAFSELYHVNSAASNSAYDGLDRLKEFRRGTINAGKTAIPDEDTTRRQVYTLDQVGNWAGFDDDAGPGGTGAWDLNQTRTNNDANEIDGISQGSGQSDWIVPAYDARGNMTSGPQPSGPYTGAAVKETTKLHFKYDAWGRLASVKTDSGGEPDALVVKYQYDGLNRRIAKLLPDDSWNRWDYYYNNSWQCLEECYDENLGNDSTAATTVKCQYVWSLRYIDSPVLRDRDADGDSETGNLGKTDSGLDERLYYTTDANMNITALVDTTGAVQERYVYDAYGKATIYDDDWSETKTWAASKANEILYCGYCYDPESNLYHVRNRYYHPTLGRWTSRDREGYVDGMNLYEYVGSRPTLFTDPVGLCRVSNVRVFVEEGKALSTLDREVTVPWYSTMAMRCLFKNWLDHAKPGMYSTTRKPTQTGQLLIENRGVLMWGEGEWILTAAPKALRIGYWLFFVDFDVCESQNNKCKLAVFETAQVRATMPDGKIRDAKKTTSAANLDWPVNGISLARADLAKPAGEANKRLIWADEPGLGPVAVGRITGSGTGKIAVSGTIHIDQELMIVDSKGTPQAWVGIEMWVTVDKKGVTTKAGGKAPIVQIERLPG